MQSLSRIGRLPTMWLRRARGSLGVSFREPVSADERETSPLHASPDDVPVENHEFRVTDRLRRWKRVRYFDCLDEATAYARRNGGVVWERYAGPLGAMNWWSLTEAECEQRTRLPGARIDRTV